MPRHMARQMDHLLCQSDSTFAGEDEMVDLQLVREYEDVARVTFKEGGDDFSPKIKAEPPKRIVSTSQKRTTVANKFSKTALTVCSVPGCKSKYLVRMGVKLTGFQVPQPSNPSFEKVWMKWIHALGYSSSEKASKICNYWAKICELHFTEDCIVLSESTMQGKKIRLQKRLLPGSYPTLSLPVPEIVLEDPRLVFKLDPIIGDCDIENSKSSLRVSWSEKLKMYRKIVAEAEEVVQKELDNDLKPSVLPPSILERGREDYQKRVKELLKELDLETPPSFLDSLINTLGLKPEPEMDSNNPSNLPPCTILKPVAKEGEAPLPAIFLPGIDHSKAIELLEDDNIQNLLKNLADKHRDEILSKIEKEGEQEAAIPPPPPIILQATELCPNQSPDPLVPDIVQQAIDKTFYEQQTAKKAQQQRLKLDEDRMLSSALNRQENPYNLDHEPNSDLYCEKSLGDTNFPTFDPTGLRQEVERWRLEVETLRQKNLELKSKLDDVKFMHRPLGIRMHGNVPDDKKLEKLESTNQRMTEELVRLKLERRRMMNKERNRRRKRMKVLERRQKRRDWIMKQIELGNMTKEHLELVYSRKKLPYEKKGNQSSDFNSYPGTISSHDSAVAIQQTGNSMEIIHEPVMLKKHLRGFSNVNSQHNTFDDLSGVTSVVVTDMQNDVLNDENVVSVSSIPGVVITGRLHGTHQIIVEGTGEDYTPEQIDLIVKAVDDLEVNSWKIDSSLKSFTR